MKAMLVIDIDDNTEIEFYDVRVWLYDQTTGFEKWYQDVQLKPMQRKIVNRSTEKDNQYYYDLGFNDCIDEILGETE